MTDMIFTGDSDKVMAAEISEYVARIGWSGVAADWQWSASVRGTARTATVQKRGAFYFAATLKNDGTAKVVGPAGTRKGAVRHVLDLQ